MKVIIAEKPSLARNIAESIGQMKRKDGYFEDITEKFYREKKMNF